MTRNEITNEIELNLAETHMLKNIGAKTTDDNPTSVDSQYGEITMRKNCVGSFTASICNDVYMDIEFAFSASEAFMRLATKLKEDRASRFVYVN